MNRIPAQGVWLLAAGLFFSTACMPSHAQNLRLNPLLPTVDTTITLPSLPLQPLPEPLQPPSGLICATWPTLNTGSNGLTLNWNDTNTNETGYVIEKGTFGIGFEILGQVGADTTHFSISQPQGSSNEYRVYAISGTEKTEPCKSVKVYGFPYAPGSLKASPGIGPENSIMLNWEPSPDNNSPEITYIIERTGGGDKKMFQETGIYYTDTTVTPDVIYTYTVRTRNSGGLSAPTDPQSLKVLAAPTNLSANYWPPVDGSLGPVTIGWTDNSSNENGFVLEYMQPALPDLAPVLFNLPANTNHYNINVLPDTEYMFHVKAISSEGSSVFTSAVKWRSPKGNTVNTAAAKLTTPLKITLSMGKSTMLVDGKTLPIDPGSNTMPVLTPSGRTLIPIRSLIEQMGGTIDWNSLERKVTITLKDQTVVLVIDNSEALVNGKKVTSEVPPQIIGGRTMLPLRFVGENLGLNVKWNPDTKTIDIDGQ